MAEYMFAWQCDWLMCLAKGFSAHNTCVDGVELCVDEIVHGAPVGVCSGCRGVGLSEGEQLFLNQVHN